MQTTLVEPEMTQKSETDYERWLSQKGQHFDQPLYHPPMQGHQMQIMSHSHIQPSNSHIVSHNTMLAIHICYFLGLVLMGILLSLAIMPPRRRRLQVELPFFEEKRGISGGDEKTRVDMNTASIVTIEKN
ncbi:hypothetical protein PVAR5_4889 [Paecilomyces variotii No. 5]|uniref:Uncharacterized protein n=1 Tax=Byssochlamys spectabilis (strain No. 5 / NBRC 109023) TaxID=1356009 RepID=V5FFA7_BYSSN|nr:hypothetical protein PVAR5_4889 [Paecilomyces variotii No. 5]